MKTMLILGSIVDGLQFIGPFADHPAAIAYAERVYARDLEWTVAVMETPAKAALDKLDFPTLCDQVELVLGLARDRLVEMANFDNEDEENPSPAHKRANEAINTVEDFAVNYLGED